MDLVRLDNVAKQFATPGGVVHAVNGVSLAIGPSEMVAVIGESGSGKSTLGKLILGLHRVDQGSIEFEGRDLGSMTPAELRAIRARMTVVFQEPAESLNPRMTIGENVAEPLRIHERQLSRYDLAARVRGALNAVSLSPEIAERSPRQLSGGQQQRVGIARAIVTNPTFVILDEPTSSLDLSLRAQILGLLAELQERLGLSFLFISHDIHTVSAISDRIAVMYLGQIVEMGPTAEVFREPRHPYTLALLSSTLSADPLERLSYMKLEGEIPKPTDLPEGCFFFSRCKYRHDHRCATERPPMREVAPGHFITSFYELGHAERMEAGYVR